MEPLPGCNIKYLNISRNDEAWGLVVTTAGYQAVAAHSSYPQAQHPESHIFDPGKGRVLKEYQLVYISRGEGYFESRSCRRQRIRAGTMILLFPGEWHTYEPDRATGWFEHWVGFRGGSVDAQVANGFFSPRNPLFGLGFSQTIIGMYEELVGYALREQAGYQQVAAGIVQFLLGSVYYKHRNLLFNDSMAIRKIDEARALIKREVEGGLTPQGIAERLSVSYSWFRKMFRQYAGASPAQYLSQIRFLRAKELLDTTELTVAEIAYRLRFETPSHFSTFFRKREGVPPQRITLIDEREEIAVMYRGQPQMDVGPRTDVLSGCPKALAIPMALRAMNPQIIAVDEITVREDLRAISQAAGCGVALLATIHAANVEELQAKPLYQELLAGRVFRQAVLIRTGPEGRLYAVENLP